MFRMENKGSLSLLSYPNILPAQFHGIEYNKHSHANIFHLHIFNSETIKVLFLIWWQCLSPKKRLAFQQLLFCPVTHHLAWPESHPRTNPPCPGRMQERTKRHTQLAGVTSNASDINHEMKTFHNQNDETVKHNMQRHREWIFKKESCKSYTYLLYAYVYDHLHIHIMYWYFGISNNADWICR